MTGPEVVISLDDCLEDEDAVQAESGERRGSLVQCCKLYYTM